MECFTWKILADSTLSTPTECCQQNTLALPRWGIRNNKDEIVLLSSKLNRQSDGDYALQTVWMHAYQNVTMTLALGDTLGRVNSFARTLLQSVLPSHSISNSSKAGAHLSSFATKSTS